MNKWCKLNKCTGNVPLKIHAILVFRGFPVRILTSLQIFLRLFLVFLAISRRTPGVGPDSLLETSFYVIMFRDNFPVVSTVSTVAGYEVTVRILLIIHHSRVFYCFSFTCNILNIIAQVNLRFKLTFSSEKKLFLFAARIYIVIYFRNLCMTGRPWLSLAGI
jgi:hypothetical protein